jgi:hypothetical protein
LGITPWAWKLFFFQDGANEAKATFNGTRQLAIGLDNVYRKYNIGNKIFPEMYRGGWETPSTFVVEGFQLGMVFKVVFRSQFSGNTVNVRGNEVYSGSQFNFQGEMNPQFKRAPKR